MKKYIFIAFQLIVISHVAQDKLQSVMSLSEYLGYVKKFHPIVKQANLLINKSESKLLKARGAFDPEIQVDFDKKKFNDKEYYNKFNSTFKIPTYYGLEFKANFENNSGLFINPESDLPNSGLYSAGISISLLKGLLINKRMASLKQAKIFTKQAKEQQQILINKILYNASLSYFKWLQTYKKKLVYDFFLNNAKTRFNSTKRLAEIGDKAEIDTIEAKIILNSRKLNLEKARINLIKSSLELSNYLWLNNNTPIELQENIIPDISTLNNLDTTFNITLFNDINFEINSHPKIKTLEYKIKSLSIDSKLKMNNLLPQIDFQYNFLTQTPSQSNSLNIDNFKAGVNFKLPIFLRKQRGELKLAEIKLLNAKFENMTTKFTIKNEINAIVEELKSIEIQNDYTSKIVKDYGTLLKAEERKFYLGESSLFLVNYREAALIEAKLKAIDLENIFFKSKASLFKATALSINL